jgi:hypothetical protein
MANGLAARISPRERTCRPCSHLRLLRRNHREKEEPVAKETFITRLIHIINTHPRSSKNPVLVDSAMRTPQTFRQKIAATCISNSTSSLSTSNNTNSRSVNLSSTGRFFLLAVLLLASKWNRGLEEPAAKVSMSSVVVALRLRECSRLSLLLTPRLRRERGFKSQHFTLFRKFILNKIFLLTRLPFFTRACRNIVAA